MKSFFTLLFLSISTLFFAQNIPMYVGTNNGAEGIYRFEFNPLSGELSNSQLVTKVENASFLAFSSTKNYLYSVSTENNEPYANSYQVNKDGSLTLINRVSSKGDGPCHIALNEKNDQLVVSNYRGGTVAIYPVLKNGSLLEASQVFDHNTDAKKAHAHSAKFLKNNLFVADLGRDFLAQYTNNKGVYTHKENFMMVEGAGPRHFEISKKGAYIYVINELNSTITVLKKDGSSYKNVQSIGTLRDDYLGINSCADIHLSKNEEFLYGSNRGENSIVVFRRNKRDGTLIKIQNIGVQGDWPRNFTISPNGNYLLVANQKSQNISVYAIDSVTGKIAFKYSIKTPIPVCLLF